MAEGSEPYIRAHIETAVDERGDGPAMCQIPRAVGAADGRTGAFWPSTGPAAKAQARAPSATTLHAARTVTPLERPAKIFSGFLPNDLQKPVRGLIHSLDQAPDGYFTVGVAGFEPTTSSSRMRFGW
ncbi:hypothetical protein SY2F82_61120 [Streptomyces sp. Y2F8-2]|nr:hypothetical protein SY2F82_61120 [Streptomyces sp. Y2F8-2]